MIDIKKQTLTLMVLVFLANPFGGIAQSKTYHDLIDKRAPNWSIDRWVNSDELEIDDLKGKVVLIRWWLETCPYCRASAPSLNEFYKEWKKEGLEIIGMYHPKPYGRKVTTDEIATFTREKDFQFPVAIDEDWDVLRRYWPNEIQMSYTSVSFVIDRKGIIRYIHPGGSYSALAMPNNDEQWRQDYYEIKSTLEQLLNE